MIQGTTALFKFKLPYTKEELMWVTIEFWQPGNGNSLLPVTKRLDHCNTSNNPKELCVSLTSEETNRFLEKYKARVQLRGQCVDGTIFGSREQLITVYPMRDGIIEGDPTLPSANDEGLIILDGKAIMG